MGSNPTLSVPLTYLPPPRPGSFPSMLRLRRSPWLRLIAVLLLIGSPGLGGTGLQALHGCTEKMPWLAAQAAGAAQDHHGSHHEAPAEPDCHCIGQCQATPAMPTAGESHLSPVADLPAVVPVLTGESRVAPAGRTAHRLPPATAPPLI